jgi:glycosyltransferase involved in cell wall biosynthesis
MGRGHDIETVLAAAESFRERDDVVFLFIGDGVKSGMVSAATRENPCIRLLPYQQRETLSQSLSAGDLHLVTQDANTEGLMEPSKLYGAMAAGRPVLYVGPEGTEAAWTVRRERIGEVVANGDRKGAAVAILRLLEDGGSGERARATLDQSYGRKMRTAHIAEVINAEVRS